MEVLNSAFLTSHDVISIFSILQYLKIIVFLKVKL